MLNVGKIEEGFVLDHMNAGESLQIYHDLKLDELDCTVAMIMNARSQKMGKKDILKVECSIDMLVDELNAGHDVIVAVDGNELIGNYPSEKIKDVEMGETANHAVIVQHVDMVKDIVTVHDPQSINDTDQYPLDQFVDAWEDSRRFMVSVG